VTNPDLPPPPPLAPPKGYVGYTPTNWGTGLRRVGGLAKALVIVLAVFAIGQVITTATIPSGADAAVEFLADGDEDAFDDSLVPYQIGSSLTGAAQIAIAVLSIIWLYRVAANHRGLGRQLTWAPAWAIAGWFLPPLLFIIPLLMIRESWKASTPDVPPGSADWKRQGDSPLVWVWFVLFVIAPIALLLAGTSQFSTISPDREDLAEYFDEQQGVIIASGVISILAAIAWALVVREITRRQTQLSGEATTR
jgi:Domain of unknown function (DUF4328)